MVAISSSLLFLSATAWAAASPAHHDLAPRQNGFRVTQPQAGDTVTAPDFQFDTVAVPIKWTVPSDLADRPVIIQLMRGSDVNDLELIDTIESNAENSGKYTWDAGNADIRYDSSGCNYTIRIKAWTQVAYSGYFAIINLNQDDGIPSDAVCPFDRGAQKPSESNYEALSSISSAASAGPTGATSQEQNTSGGNSGGSSGGVSTTTLAVAVAVPIVVLLIAFAVVLILGIRKGWFLRKKDREAAMTYPKERDMSADPALSTNDKGPLSSNVGELGGDGLPHRLDGNPIYQLDANETTRR